MRARKEPWSRPLADLVGPIIDPVLAKRGFGQSDVILYWDEIVGARLASMSQPVKLNWPPRPRGAGGGSAPASLVVRVESGFALEGCSICPAPSSTASTPISAGAASTGWC